MKIVLSILLAAICASASAAGVAADWNVEAFNQAAADSGRAMKLTPSQFKAIQARKLKALKKIEKYLKDRFKKADPEVMRAFKEVPREYFHFQYKKGESLARAAWEEKAKPWAIGYGSALSDYLGQAYMTQLLDVKPEHKVLEIGTGSGFQISLLSRLAGEVYSVEIQQPLGEAVAKIFAPLGYSNVHTRVGDGFFGWPEVEGGFDRIMVTCAAQYVPPALFDQLKPGGIMVIPVGQPFKRHQLLYVCTKDAAGQVFTHKYPGVYFVPMTGEIGKQKQETGKKAGPKTETKEKG